MPDLVLRRKETYDKYMELIASGALAKRCGICNEKLIKDFKYWKIVDNRFPWNRIAEVHHMIIPKRHITYEKLNKAEKEEYQKIRSKYLDKQYDLIAEATLKKKSIKGHLHLHLIILRKK